MVLADGGCWQARPRQRRRSPCGAQRPEIPPGWTIRAACVKKAVELCDSKPPMPPIGWGSRANWQRKLQQYKSRPGQAVSKRRFDRSLTSAPRYDPMTE